MILMENVLAKLQQYQLKCTMYRQCVYLLIQTGLDSSSCLAQHRYVSACKMKENVVNRDILQNIANHTLISSRRSTKRFIPNYSYFGEIFSRKPQWSISCEVTTRTSWCGHGDRLLRRKCSIVGKGASLADIEQQIQDMKFKHMDLSCSKNVAISRRFI